MTAATQFQKSSLKDFACLELLVESLQLSIYCLCAGGRYCSPKLHNANTESTLLIKNQMDGLEATKLPYLMFIIHNASFHLVLHCCNQLPISLYLNERENQSKQESVINQQHTVWRKSMYNFNNRTFLYWKLHIYCICATLYALINIDQSLTFRFKNIICSFISLSKTSPCESSSLPLRVRNSFRSSFSTLSPFGHC